ncbi:flagellar filament capping protein FliD [Oscillospiraceae bacterium PP1C4]
MNTVSSSSSYSTKASTNKGMSGLISGMDTESLVESMLSGTQTKIDKQNTIKQQTVWKQELYRDVVTQINAFQMKYFDYTSNTNLMSSSFFNTMASVSSNLSAVKVNAASSATAGKTKIEVGQLATSASVKSAIPASGALSGEIDAATISKDVVFTANGTEVKVNLNGVKDNAAIIAKVNAAFTGEGITGVTASVDAQGKLTLKSDSAKVKVSSKSTAVGLETLGLTAGAKIDSAEGTLAGTINTKAVVSINISLDGISKTITLDPEKILAADNSIDKAKAITELQSEIDNKFGAGAITLADQGSGKFTMTTASNGRQVVVYGEGAAALGMVSGESNKISMGMQLKDLNFAKSLTGGLFTFTINGKEFTASSEDTLGSVLNKINSSDAGVKITYSSLEDKFNIEATSSGAGFNITMSQTTGNLLSAMFGVETGGSVASNVLVKNFIQGKNPVSDLEANRGAQFKINVDGTDYSFVLPARNNEDGTPKPYTKEEALAFINEELESQFGFTNDGKQAIALSADGKLAVNNGAVVKFEKTAANIVDGAGNIDEGLVKIAAKNDLALAFGLNREASSNLTDVNTTLEDVGLGGLNGSAAGTKLSELSGVLKYDEKTGRILFTTSGDGASVSGTATDGSSYMKKLFGADTVNFSSTTGLTAAASTAGVNAKVTINGVETERSSNNFTVDGLNIELLKKTAADEPVIIDTTRNTTQIVDTVKSFIKDYNAMLEKFNGYLDEDATYKKYPPLTSAQKKEMSDKEIELWEEKSKVGLLRKDSTISGFLSSVRTILYQKPADAQFALYDLGITTGEYKDRGKLVIEDEALFKQKIEQNSDEIQKLFNDPTEGILKKMNTAINETAKVSSAEPGMLVKLAGMKGKASEGQNTLSKRIQQIEDKITSLKTIYEQQKKRYWNQFNTMEKMVSSFSSQSAWLAQMFQ